VYVLVVDVSGAVTTTEMAFVPTLRDCALDAAPDVTAADATVTVAPNSSTVGVNMIDAMLFTTLAV
jgi:hypothetical protein